MSIFDHPVATVMTWRCPHCGTLQPEASRCWACMRSPVSCSMCRYYRRSVVSQVGLCGRDRSRGPLGGDEIEPCWEAAVDAPATGIFARSSGPVTPRGDAPDAAQADAGIASMSAAPARGKGVRAPADRVPSSNAAGRLVEAPVVDPSHELTSEALRRARLRRGAARQ